MSGFKRKVTESQKKNIAGKQFGKCANNNSSTLKGLETYDCPLWEKENNKGSFDASGYDIDHINEHCLTGDDSDENLQALCLSCHRVKTKKFNSRPKIRIPKKHKLFGKQLDKYGKHKVYLASSKDIYKHTKIWSKNRPVDKLRLEAMADYFTKTNHIDGIIYLAVLEDEGIVCYDGNHRRESIQYIPENLNINVLVDVVEHPTYHYLCHKFKSLNQCVPVCELDSNPDEYSEAFKLIIYSLVDRISYKWQDHKVSSPNPKRPNFNRDKLTGILTTFLTENMIYPESVDDLFSKLLMYNENIKKNITTYKVSSKILDKCHKNNCYLFLDKNLQQLDHFVK